MKLYVMFHAMWLTPCKCITHALESRHFSRYLHGNAFRYCITRLVFSPDIGLQAIIYEADGNKRMDECMLQER